jgi:hypothetical protein
LDDGVACPSAVETFAGDGDIAAMVSIRFIQLFFHNSAYAFYFIAFAYSPFLVIQPIFYFLMLGIVFSVQCSHSFTYFPFKT